jgi:hypothetical protein
LQGYESIDSETNLALIALALPEMQRQKRDSLEDPRTTGDREAGEKSSNPQLILEKVSFREVGAGTEKLLPFVILHPIVNFYRNSSWD